MDQLKKILEWLKSFPENYWKKYTSAQKMLFGGTIGAIVVAIVLMISFAANPNWSLLIRGLAEAEAGKVIEALEEQGIPYKTASGGSIYVPASYDPEALRMKFFTQGVLGAASRGFEILDDQPLGATSFDKQVRYQIALQGSLERSIMSIDGIRFATVHLTVPKFTYYARGEETEPKASVMLTLDPGKTLSPENVKAIMELVAGAVEGLAYSNVRVVDNYSRILSDAVALDESMGWAANRMEFQKNMESYYSQKIRSSLEQVFGLGRVVVISDVLLNWETIEKEATIFTPVLRKTGVMVSEQTEKESSTYGAEGYPVGVDSNVPPTYESTIASLGPQYTREKETVNYNVNEAYEKVLQNKQGEILEKNITVLIDSVAVASEIQTSSIKTIVANAVNATESNVEVEFLAFDRSIQEEMESQMEFLERQRRFFQLFLGMALLVASIVTLIYLLVGRMRTRRKRRDIMDRRRKLEEELVESASQDKLSPEEQELVEMLESLFKAVDARPEEVAMVLKVWMNE
ncbi:MAG TPA: flagellar basal-body MS-ring/collar protein FliF [Thermotogota bacterium]|nr:flagellar basal-body MS-ring/collar protein FliF [Thermotogota bacterium]HRW91602.1 flagellar basal-body MS-ring/collar protein FliF [Thermotogota bacterium]